MVFDNYLEVELKIHNNLLFKFTDYLNNGADLSTFTRVIKNQ